MKRIKSTIHFSLSYIRFFLLIFILFYIPPILAQQQWELIHNTNTDIGIDYVFMYDTNHIWGMTQNDVYFSPDGGGNWELQFEEEGNYYSDIQFLDSLNGYFVMLRYAYKTLDGGNEWNRVLNTFGTNYMTLYFINADTGWIAGEYCVIRVTYDGGENWIIQNAANPEKPYDIRDLHFFDAMHGCAVGGLGGQEVPYILTTSDGGENWTEIFPEGNFMLVKVQFLDQDHVWCADDYDSFFRSDDGGYTWQKVISLGLGCLDDFHFFNDTTAIAVSECRPYQCLTSDAWQSWQENEIYSNNVVSNLSFCDDKNGIGVGNGGHVLRTNDAGNTWRRLNEEFSQIGFFSPMNGWVIQSWMNKNFMHTTDGGFTWHEIETGHSGVLVIIDIVSDHTAYSMTDQIELLKTTDAGASWQIVDTDLDTMSFTDMQFLDENTGFMCASPGAFYKTVNGGKNWESHSFDSVNVITSLYFLDELEGWVAGYQGFLAHTKDGGTHWETSNLPSYRLSDIEFINNQIGYVLSYDMMKYSTNDGGATWQQMNLEQSPLYWIEFIDPLHGWIYGSGGLLATHDGGDHWDEVLDLQSDPDDRVINDVFALDSNNAWICTAGGRIFSSAYFVGTKEDNIDNKISAYPNPVNEVLNMDLNSWDEKQVIIKTFSIDGRLLSKQIYSLISYKKITLDFSGFPKGIYFVTICGTNYCESHKILKN
jgi:photosystem II stability/assembly factor-like uncharacterized protein